jgi:hypothetical protein
MKNNDAIKLGEHRTVTQLGIRDALHVPVIVVKAHATLQAGEPVGITDDHTVDDNHIGVVDPFLQTDVLKGLFVAVLLKPNSTMRVRHDWEHPGIEHTNKDLDDATDGAVEAAKSIPMNPEPKSVSVEYEPETIFHWDTYAESICEILGCSMRILNEGIEHQREYGTSLGGTQPNLSGKLINKVDWKYFWVKYNETHDGPNIGRDDDPFCCSNGDEYDDD